MQGPRVQPDSPASTTRSMMPRDLLPSIAQARLLLAALIAVGFAIAVGTGLVLNAIDARGPLDERLPRLANVGILLLPLLCWMGALLLVRWDPRPVRHSPDHRDTDRTPPAAPR